MKVTVEQAYAACKVGRITRDEPSLSEVTLMQQRLQSFTDQHQVLPKGWRLSVSRGVLPHIVWLQLDGPQCTMNKQADTDVARSILDDLEAALAVQNGSVS